MQDLLQQRDHRGTDRRAPNASGAADHGHEQVFDALIDSEGRRVHKALEMCVKPAGDTRQQRGVDERDDLEARAVDAERLGHFEAAFERADRTTGARIEQVVGRP